MVQTRLIPVLLLKDGQLYKTTKFKDPKYIGDPRNAVKIFNEKEVDELCLLDISATPLNRRPNFMLVEELANECFMPISYGGGVRTIEDIKTLFSLGVEKVILNSILYSNIELVRSASEIFGDQSIVASLDVRKNLWGQYELRSNCVSVKQNRNIFEFISELEDIGIGELFLNSIDRDGTMQGMDLDLVRKVADHIKVPLVACGGVGSLQHIQEVYQNTEVSAVGLGSFVVYHGKHRAVLITYPNQEVIKQTFNG